MWPHFALLVSDIDALIARQLDRILHHASLQELESGWRGVMLLCEQVIAGSNCRLRILDASHAELLRDGDSASAVEHSALFHLIYDQEFDHAGGEPFGVLLGNFSLNPACVMDQRLLLFLAEVAQSAFCPLLAGASPQFFGVNSFGELEGIELEKTPALSRAHAYARLRRQDVCRFAGLLLPHILLRAPWQVNDSKALIYREHCENENALLWGNAVFALGSAITRVFAETGWFTHITGHSQATQCGGTFTLSARAQSRAPSWCFAPLPDVDAIVSDRLERDLASAGFSTLCHDWNTRHATFFSLPALHYDEEHGRRSVVGLQHMLCVSRFAHYIKQMMRDRIGSLKSRHECLRVIEDWLLQYTSSSTDTTTEIAARYPLRQSRAEVYDDFSAPGRYRCQIHLVPHVHGADAVAEISLTTQLSS